MLEKKNKKKKGNGMQKKYMYIKKVWCIQWLGKACRGMRYKKV